MKHLYCAGKVWKTLPKTNCQTVLAFLEKVASLASDHRFSPLPLRAAENMPSVFFFVNVKFLETSSYFTWECKLSELPPGEWGYNIQLGGDWNGLVAWLQTLVTRPVSKETPTMKIYRGETVQVLKVNTWPAPFFLSKWPYNIHAN